MRTPNQGTTQQRNKSETPIGITATGLACVYGDHPAALLGGVATRIKGSEASTRFKLALPYSEGQFAPMLVAPCPQLPDSLSMPQQRINTLATMALTQLLNDVPDAEGPTRLVLLVPSTTTIRGKQLDHSALAHTLSACHPHAAHLRIDIISTDQAPNLLDECCRELQQQSQQRIIFGGVDSLVDDGTCMQLVQEGQAMTQQHDQGIIPGEAAAFVCLESPQNSSCTAVLSTCHSAPEPNTGKGGHTSLKGLSTAIKTCLAKSPAAATLDCCILPFGSSMADAFEWYQAVEQCWPQQLKKFHEELRPRQFIGDIGAATLPLYLILGRERFTFSFDPLEQLFICTATPESWRTAILLSKP